MKDYYKILGVSKDATQDEIKKAFHRLAHKYHPHKGGDEKKFKEINEAYQVLSNKAKRGQYDRFGSDFESAQGFDAGWFWGKSGQRGPDMGFDFEDLGDIFGEFFGASGAKGKKNPKKGQDIQIDIEITLEEAASGIRRNFALRKMVSCSRCQGRGAEPGTEIEECFSCRGTGEVQEIKRTFLGSFTRWAVCPECQGEGQKPKNPCNVCKGEGRVEAKDDIEIFVPPGVDSNQVIKVNGKGDAGRKGGPAGNLFARVFVKKHDVFSRKGDDLYITLPITFSQAALGDEIEAPVLGEKSILLKIPSGSESGKTLRLSGKGLPHFTGYGKGNEYVILDVRTPRRLSKRQKELLEKLKEEGL